MECCKTLQERQCLHTWSSHVKGLLNYLRQVAQNMLQTITGAARYNIWLLHELMSTGVVLFWVLSHRQQCKIAYSLQMMLSLRPIVPLDFIHDRLNSDCIPSQCYSIPTRPPQQFQQSCVVQQKLSHGCFQDFSPCRAVFEVLHCVPAANVNMRVLLHVIMHHTLSAKHEIEYRLAGSHLSGQPVY